MIIQTTDNGRNGRWPTFSEARKALPQGARGKWIFSPRADAEKAYLPDAGETFVIVSHVDSRIHKCLWRKKQDFCKYYCVLVWLFFSGDPPRDSCSAPRRNLG